MGKIISPNDPNYNSVMQGIRDLVDNRDYKFNEYNQFIVDPLEPRDIEKARDILEDYDGYRAEPIVCLNEESDICKCYEGESECILLNIIPPDCGFKKEIALIRRLKVVKNYQIEYDMTDFFADEEIIYNYSPKSKTSNGPVNTVWKDSEENEYEVTEYYFNRMWLAESQSEKGTRSFFIKTNSSLDMECPMFIDPKQTPKWIIPKAIRLDSESENKDVPMELVVIRSDSRILAVIYRYKRKRHWIKREIMERIKSEEKKIKIKSTIDFSDEILNKKFVPKSTAF